MEVHLQAVSSRKGCLKKPLLRNTVNTRLNNSGTAPVSNLDTSSIRLTNHNQLKGPESAVVSCPEAEKENLNAIIMRRRNTNIKNVDSNRPVSCLVEPTVSFHLHSGQQQQQKKQIRFAGIEDSPETTLEATPPPKEFKRANPLGKTMRPFSMLVTEVDRTRAALQQQEQCCLDSPKAPSGFVRSMCQLYEDVPATTAVNKAAVGRSNSFNMSLNSSGSSNSSQNNSSSSSSQADSQSPSPRLEERQGKKTSSFKGLFRSRSWSIGRSKQQQKSQPDEFVIQPTADHETFVPKRCSPSYSTKSQDSGFSDEGSNGGVIVRKLKSPPKDVTTSANPGGTLTENGSIVSSIASTSAARRSEFFNEGEEDSDPNLTQLPDSARDRVDTIYKYSVNHSTSSAANQVMESIGNIASLNEGLRLKRSMVAEAAPPSGDNIDMKMNFYRQCLNVSNSLKNLTSFSDAAEKATEKAPPSLPRPPLGSPRISPSDCHCGTEEEEGFTGADRGLMAFSTPVRSSFRRQTTGGFQLEDAKTPSKRVPKNSKLKEIKSKRRWSNIELAELQHQLTLEVDVDEELGRTSKMQAPQDSMVAVWSQYLEYEPTLPQLSECVSAESATTPASQQLSSTQLSEIHGPSLLSDDAPSQNSSLRVDGTETQLMADSLCERVVRHHQPVVNDGPIFEELVEEDDVEDDSRDATLTLGPVKKVKSRPPADVTAANVTSANDSSTFLTPRPAVACVTIPAASPLSQQEEAIIEMEDIRQQPTASLLDTSSVTKSPVGEWWRDLHAWCEPECMTYLQSKPILSNNNTANQSPNASTSTMTTTNTTTSSPGSSSVSTARSSTAGLLSASMTAAPNTHLIDSVQKLQTGAKTVQRMFSSLNNQFNAMELSQTSRTIQEIQQEIQNYVFDFNVHQQSLNLDPAADETAVCEGNNMPTFPGLKGRTLSSLVTPSSVPEESAAKDRDRINEIVMLQQRSVLQLVDRLKLCAHRSQYTPQQPVAEMRKVLCLLDKSFHNLVSKMITKEIKILIRDIESPSSELELRAALNTVIQLGNETSNLARISQVCNVFAVEGGVRTLLRLCDLSATSVPQKAAAAADVRVLSLRSLGAICCVAECIRQFESCGGLRIIDDLLSSRVSSVEDRVESAAVLAQITSPWIADNHKVHDLDLYVMSMVKALTGLSRLNGNEETFLLVTAALANLTFMSPLTASAMKRVKTAETLVKVVKMSPYTTLFAKDQVVTILANMAGNAACRPDIQGIDGVGFLLDMLDTKVAPAQQPLSPAEGLAAERVLKKAAIALSRLANDPTVCRDIVRLGGVDRLVELCKVPAERSYSDAILVACLAVLRRLKTNLNSEVTHVLASLGANDLVKAKLVDSFVEHSTNKQESYV